MTDDVAADTRPAQAAARHGYEVIERVAAGTFGVVYRARQEAVGRDVALKVIKPEWADQPEFIRRFDAEAQVVARLEHPRVVPLYDYWREPGGAYLVMRWVSGGSVQDALRRGPFRPESALGVVEQVADALDAAHRRGVIHRDLKPANVLLDREDNAYLTDFGIAKHLDADMTMTGDGGVLGTPAAIAPEQIRGDATTPQTDVYTLGLLAWELLAGNHPWEGEPVLSLLDRQLRDPLPPLRGKMSWVPEMVDEVIAKATAKDPAARYETASSFAAALRAALAGEALPDQTATIEPVGFDTAPPTADNPYKGLRAFHEADASDFFGRDGAVGDILARLRLPYPKGRFVAVVGPSGSGKSSLIRAGVIPALRDGAVPGSERWFVAEMIPGRHPFEELEAALLRVAINPPPSLLEQLTADNRGLSRAVKRILSDDDSELVLLIDQFEELFTLVEDSETRNLLLETLTEAASDERSRLRVMVTLRADFFDRPLAYNQFGELLRQNLEAIVPMSAGELEQAVVGPAHRVGLAVEPSVVTQIVAEVSDQPGALPMLQYALTELFERRTGDLIDISGYEAVGGVLGALARRAEELFRRLDADEQDAARQLFLRLVTLGEGVEDTRRRVPRREAAGLGAAVEPVIEHFGRYRLLSFDRDPVTFEPTVEVAHEALLRQWPRFKRWVEESRDDLRLHRRLDSAAAEWETADREPGYLMSGLRLAQLEDWQARTDMTLSPTESEFLAESQAAAAAARRIEEERQAHELMLERRAKTRTRILLAVLTVAALVSAGLTVFALRESGQAEEAARLSRSRELAAFSVSSLQTDLELAVLLAVEAVETTGSAGEDVPAEAVDALHRALAALRTVFRLDSTFTAISADGSLVASVTGDSVILASPEGQQTGQIDIAGAASIALDSSGSRIAAGTVSGEVVLVDVGTQAELRRFQAHDERIRRINFGGEADQFLVTSSDDGLARAWHVDSAEPFFAQAHSGDSPGIAIDNSGERIVHGTGFGGIEAYESDGLVFERSDADIGTGGTSAADLTSDGRSLAAGTVSGSVIVSSFGGSAPVPITDAHAGAVTDVVFVSSDSAVASAGTDGKVRVWDASTGRQILDLPGAGGEVAHLAAAGDLLIASGEWGSVTWNIGPSGTRESTIFAGGGPTTAATISPDGARVFTADGVGRIWDPDGVLITTLTHEKGTVGEIAASAGRVATSGPLAAYTWSSEGTNQVEMFLDTGTSGLETAIPGLAISPDGNVVASSRGTGNLRVWDARDGNELAELSGHEGDIPAVAFSPDGSLLATGDDQGNLLLWDTATWLPASAPLQPAILGISDIAFSADSAQLLLAGMDGTAAAYELRSDGLTASFEPGFTLRGHVGAVLSIASSPDGLTVATGGADNTVRLWDAETGTEVLRLVAQTDDVSDLAFSSGGTELLAASLDGVTRIYVLDLDTLVELARSRISRDLTDEECQRFLQTACPTRET